MTRRDAVLNLISSKKSSDYIPAAFFMHFDPAYHQGQAAIDKTPGIFSLYRYGFRQGPVRTDPASFQSNPQSGRLAAGSAISQRIF